MKKVLLLFTLSVITLANSQAQNIFPIIGKAGIGTITPRTALDIWGGALSVTGPTINGTAVVTSQNGTAFFSCNSTTNGIGVDANGNVGIGTTDTKGYRLAVNGSAIFTSAKVKSYAAWPDYVFDANYALPSLADVETYIKTHKHLPGVTSADEAKKDGLDLGSSQAQLLKKIEELTLYVIQQQKEINELRKEIKK